MLARVGEGYDKHVWLFIGNYYDKPSYWLLRESGRRRRWKGFEPLRVATDGMDICVPGHEGKMGKGEHLNLNDI
jgi:hypothetical protein